MSHTSTRWFNNAVRWVRGNPQMQPSHRRFDGTLRSNRGPLFDAGLGQIIGVVDEMGVPGPYRVRLYHRTSGQFLRQVWSDVDGRYVFDNLPLTGLYFVVGFDHGAHPAQAAVADLLVPKLPDL